MRPPGSQSCPGKPQLQASQSPPDMFMKKIRQNKDNFEQEKFIPAREQFLILACCQEPPRDHFLQGHLGEAPQGSAVLGLQHKKYNDEKFSCSQCSDSPMKLTCLEFLASMVMCILSSLSLILYKLGFRIEAFALTGYQMYLKTQR